MTAARDQLHPTILKTRNRFVLNRARGFESHHLRQKLQIQTNLRLFLLRFYCLERKSIGKNRAADVRSLLNSLQQEL